jgi:hypothetical protein
MSKLYKNTRLTFKEYHKLKKLILSRDIDNISIAVSLLDGLQDEGLFDIMLEGVSYTKNELQLSPFFQDTAPAKIYRMTALVGVLYAARNTQKWSNFLRNITEIVVDTLILDYIQAFQYSQKISIWCAVKLCSKLDLPILQSFLWKEQSQFGWASTQSSYTKGLYNIHSKRKISFKMFAGCKNLRNIELHKPILMEGFDGIEMLSTLQSLHIEGLSGNFETGFKSFSACLGLQSICIINRIEDNDILVESLEGFENLKDLQHLTLHLNSLKHTHSIVDCMSLKHIKIISNCLESFSPPSNSESLKTLRLHCKSLTVVSEAFYGEELEELTIHSNNLITLPVFNGLKKIINLDLHCPNLQNLDAFSLVERIDFLSAYYCDSIKDLQGFTNVKQMERFYFCRCKSLVSLVGLENIESDKKSIILDRCLAVNNMDSITEQAWDKLILYVNKLPFPKRPIQVRELEINELITLDGIQRFTGIEILKVHLKWSDTAEKREMENPFFDFTPLEDLTTIKELCIESPPPVRRVGDYYKNFHLLWTFPLKVLRKYKNLYKVDLQKHMQLSDLDSISQVNIENLYVHWSQYGAMLNWKAPHRVKNIWLDTHYFGRHVIKKNDKGEIIDESV